MHRNAAQSSDTYISDALLMQPGSGSEKYSCYGCIGWWSVIEIRFEDPQTAFISAKGPQALVDYHVIHSSRPIPGSWWAVNQS